METLQLDWKETLLARYTPNVTRVEQRILRHFFPQRLHIVPSVSDLVINEKISVKPLRLQIRDIRQMNYEELLSQGYKYPGERSLIQIREGSPYDYLIRST